MNIKSYLASIRFDAYRLYYRENKNFETAFLDIGESSKLLLTDTGKDVQNGVRTNLAVPSSFTLVEEMNGAELINSLNTNEELNYYPNRKKTIYDCLLVFIHDHQTTRALNISLKERICRDERDLPVDLSEASIEILANQLKKVGIEVFKSYHPPSLAVLDQWRHYRYPFEFYKNPVFNAYEASLYSGLFAVNWKLARLEIAPVGGELKIGQIEKVKDLEKNRVKFRKQLLDQFWEQYLIWKDEYELPSLNLKEQLYGIIELSSIRVENDPDFSIQLFFRTWDEEHGQSVSCHDDGTVEFI